MKGEVKDMDGNVIGQLTGSQILWHKNMKIEKLFDWQWELYETLLSLTIIAYVYDMRKSQSLLVRYKGKLCKVA